MPIYEYQCQTCGKRTEVLQRMDEAPLAACPECGGEVKKLISAPAFQFKGSGWYVTDYAGKKDGKSEAQGGKSEAKDGQSETKDGGKSEAQGGKSEAAEGKSEAKGDKPAGSAPKDSAEKASPAPARASSGSE